MTELVPIDIQVNSYVIRADFKEYRVILEYDATRRDFGHFLTVLFGGDSNEWFSGYLPNDLSKLEVLKGWKKSAIGGACRSLREMEVSPVLMDWIKRALDEADKLKLPLPQAETARDPNRS